MQNAWGEEFTLDFSGKTRKKDITAKNQTQFGGYYKMNKIGWASVNQITLSQYVDQWIAFVNMVMKLRVP